jgi:molybdopterin molybdotransferase
MDHLHTVGFQKLTKVDPALRILLDALGERAVRLELLPVQRALGRCLGKDVVADQCLPPVDRSVMDGYAARVEDVKSASQENLVTLRVIGESRLGVIPRMHVGQGEAVVVATGSLVPSGADTVVIVERTTRLSSNSIAVHAPATAGQSIARKGEDVTPGALVLRKGALFRPQDIGMLKALGLAKVYVSRKPRVAVLSTGNELVNSIRRRSVARVVDINRAMLSCMLQELGADAVDLGIVKDREASIKTVLKKGLKTCDAVIVSAGSSVGRWDLVPKCVNSLGKPGMLVHGVAMRPAMPTGLAVVNGKPVFSLPGFPVSAFFAFRTFVRPIIAKMLGVKELFESTANAVLSETITGAPGNRTYVRVIIKRNELGLVAEPLKLQRSSVLMSMVSANGIVVIPEEVTAIERGEKVTVILIGKISS